MVLTMAGRQNQTPQSPSRLFSFFPEGSMTCIKITAVTLLVVDLRFRNTWWNFIGWVCEITDGCRSGGEV